MEEMKLSWPSKRPSSPIWSPNSKRGRRKDEQGRRYWPECVIAEILARLPIKSILRFKSTCKPWYSLIQSRYLIDLHRRVHLHDSHHKDEMLCCQYETLSKLSLSSSSSSISISISISNHEESTRLSDIGIPEKSLSPPLMGKLLFNQSGTHLLVGHLNNGICCVISEQMVENSITLEAYGLCDIALCNLSTREFSLVRDPFPFERRRVDIVELCKLIHFYGFGTIHNGHQVIDYKIVAIEQSLVNSRFRASAYSQRRGTWALICDSDTGFVNGIQIPRITQDLYWLPAQAYLNGSCHWMAQQQPAGCNKYLVLQFHMTNEAFGFIPAPPNHDYHNLAVRAGVFVLNDHLAAIFIVETDTPTCEHYDVWMMMEYGVHDSWTKIHSCDFHIKGYITRVLGFSFDTKPHNDDNDSTSATTTALVVDKIFFQHSRRKPGKYFNNGKLMSHDRSGFQKHCTFKPPWACLKPFGLSTYCDTLEPVALQHTLRCF